MKIESPSLLPVVSHQGTPYLNAVTGLRFAAALTVFFHHVGGKFGYALNPYCLGSLGVTFFFVLSGFILTYTYQGRIGTWVDCRQYWLTRFARIWPLHMVCLLLFIVSVNQWSVFRSAQTWWQLGFHITLLQSWIPDKNWSMGFNPVAWSISTEAFFYLVFPFLFYADGRLARWRMAGAVLLIGLCGLLINWAANTARFPGIDYFSIGHVNPLFRLPEFLLGVWFGNRFMNREVVDGIQHAGTGKTTIRRMIGDSLRELAMVALIVWAVYLYRHWRLEYQLTHSDWGSPFLGAWLRVLYPAWLFAMAIRLFASSRGILARLFAWRPCVYLGEISYAFYLIHFLILRSIHLGSPSYGTLPGWQLASLALAISVGASMLLYKFIEMPAKRKLLDWYRYGRSTEIRQGFGQWLRRDIIIWVIGVAMIVGPVLVLVCNIPVSNQTEPQLQTVVDRSPSHLKSIRFGSQVILLGAVIEPLDRSHILLKLAWYKRIDFPQRRVIRLVDTAGQTVARGANNDPLFRQAANASEFLDEVRLAVADLKRCQRIELSFRSREGSVAQRLPINTRSDFARGGNLILFTQEHLQEVLEPAK